MGYEGARGASVAACATNSKGLLDRAGARALRSSHIMRHVDQLAEPYVHRRVCQPVMKRRFKVRKC